MDTLSVQEAGRVGRLSWELLEPFGARITFGQLRDGLTAEEGDALAQLVYHHGFIEAAGQELTRDQLRRVGAAVAPLFPDDHEANKVLALDPAEGGFGTRSLAFHRDLSYAEHPFAAIALHALDVTPGASTTSLASGVRAYAALPDDLKRDIAGLEVFTALHGREDDGTTCVEDARRPGWPAWTHQLVWPHPVTGAPVLMVCEMSSAAVEGLPPDESEDLLHQLFGYLTDPSNVATHRWYTGDLLLWDNYGCTHARPLLEDVQRRTLQRLTMGKLSFPLAYPDFNMRDYTDATQGVGYMGAGGGKF